MTISSMMPQTMQWSLENHNNIISIFEGISYLEKLS